MRSWQLSGTPTDTTPTSPPLELNVDSTLDSIDAAPGDRICADQVGSCTLRAAIMEANANAGGDTITLAAGTYTLSLPGSQEDAARTHLQQEIFFRINADRAVEELDLHIMLLQLVDQ